MLSVCIFCGENKSKALEECPSCNEIPTSHKEVIHSIILCFSETEPYLNFLSLEEIEDIRARIIAGSHITISSETFSRAEEAFSAIQINNGPKVIQYFSTISVPIISIIVLTFIVTLFFY